MNARSRPRGVLVQRPRDELLAGAALAVDQNRRPARRGLDDEVEHLAHARAAADDLAEPVRARLQVLTQRAVLGDEPALRQRVAQHDQHFVVLERLGDVVVRPALHRGDRVLDRRERRDHQHRQVVVDLLDLVERRRCRPCPASSCPRSPRRTASIGRARAPRRVRRQTHVVALAREERLEDLAHDLFVVDDEDGAASESAGRARRTQQRAASSSLPVHGLRAAAGSRGGERQRRA